MDRKKLEMVFLNSGGKKFTLSIDDPKDSLTDEEVSEAMGEIIANNVFVASMLDLVEAVDARIVTTLVEPLEI